jgi:acetyl esterase/lipase
MPWIFLAVSIWGALFTWNARRPLFRARFLSVPVFFAGWLTSELAAHHIVWQALATLAFVWAGALSAWSGWLGLAITAASWAGLLRIIATSRHTEHVVESSLVEALGPDYVHRVHPQVAARHGAPARPAPRWNPFSFRDPEVRAVRDLAYAPEHGKRGLLDVYAPRAGATGAPVLLQIHGGAWMIGEKRQQALPLMMHLARRGWICVAVNYRLSPRATFPDHIVDCKRALAWVREHVVEYGGDPSFVVATGGSAGGHLCSLLALTAGAHEWQPGFEAADTTVQACVPFYGVFDFTNEFATQPDDGMQQFLARLVFKKTFEEDREAWVKASPIHRVHPDAPPFYVVHGTHDTLAPVEEARRFVDALRKISKSPVAYAELPEAQHAFEIFHSERTTHVVRAVERFLAGVRSEHLAAGAQVPRPAGSATTSITT